MEKFGRGPWIKRMVTIGGGLAAIGILTGGSCSRKPAATPTETPAPGQQTIATATTLITESPLAISNRRLQFWTDDFNRLNINEPTSETELKGLMELIPVGAQQRIFAENGQGIEPNPQNGTILRENKTASLNVPAGGWVYISSGPITVHVPDMEATQVTEGENEGIVNHTFIMGTVNGNGDSRNITAEIDNPHPGHVFVTQAQPSTQEDRKKVEEKVGREWYAQQLRWARVNPNCSVGCTKVRVYIIDANTKALQIWTIDPRNPLLWLQGKQ